MGGKLGPGDIHNALTQGPGADAFSDAQQASASLAQANQQRETQAMSLVMKMGAAWTGNASDAAQAGAAPLTQAFRDGQQALSTHHDLMSRQTDSFSVAKSSVHDIPNDPPSASFGDMLSDATGVSLFTGGGYANKVKDWSDQANANVTAYTTYAGASSYNQTNMPHDYGNPTGGSGSDITLAPTQTGSSGTGHSGSSGTGGIGGSGGSTHPVAHYGGGPGSPAWTPPGGGAGVGPGPGGMPGPGTPGYGGGPTNTQGWQGGSPSPGTGPGGWQSPGGGGPGWGSGGDGGGYPGAVGGSFGPLGGGSDSSTAGGGARGFRAGGSAGVGGAGSAGSQAGPGGRAGVGGPGAGEGGPGAAAAAGRAGAPGAPGSSGMAGGAGRGGRKEEDQEHSSAAYLEDDYSDELIGELPRTAPPVIGLD